MYKIRTALLCFFMLFSLTACEGLFSKLIGDNWSKDEEVCDTDNTAVSFKKVAYWDGANMDSINEVAYEQLDYLLYDGVQVSADGSLVQLTEDAKDDFEDMISFAQAEGVEVAISIGKTSESNLNTIAASSSLTNVFTDNVINFVQDYDLDGVDLNWQTPRDDSEGELFEDLVQALSDDLLNDGYFFSISVISGVGDDDDFGDVIDNNVFNYVDFVNVRAFDTTNSDDLHSSKQDAIDSIEYWTGRCLIQNKLVLGIPFYSAGNAVRSYNYIVDDDSDYACVDESRGRNYNGVPTVIEKTEYAISNAGGVMMQSLDQDAYDNTNYLLLDVINETESGYYVSICD